MPHRTEVLFILAAGCAASAFSLPASGPVQPSPVQSRRATHLQLKEQHDAHSSSSSSSSHSSSTVSSTQPTVYFIMGGPGSGKGTQCAKLVHRYGMAHLSAGDLLRSEVASGSSLGKEIKSVIDQGQIVRSELTVALLRAAMEDEQGPFLIDGFPRSLANLEAFEKDIGTAAFMLFLEVTEEEMEARLLKRGETSGRTDDNRETIVKRFRTFIEDSMPVVRSLEERKMLRKIDASASEEVVFSRVCDVFSDQELEAIAEDTTAAAA